MAVATASYSVPIYELATASEELPKIRSRPGNPVPPSLVGWMRPTPVDTPLEEIRSRFKNDGYVFIKGLIPREDVLDMREHYFTCFQSSGILAPGTSPRDGIFDHSANPEDHTGVGSPIFKKDEALREKIVASHVTPGYLSFLQHPALREFIRSFMEWKKDVLLSRTILRHTVPSAQSTGIHYDQIFLRAGDPRDEFLTGWIPIGDISVDGGGLMYLEDSTELGRQIEADFSERSRTLTEEERVSAFNSNMMKGGMISTDAEEFSRNAAGGKKWLTAAYEAGDVVFHNPYMIHGAAMNEDKHGRIRLSTDLRFYEEGMRLDKRWLNTFSPDDGL